MHQEGLIIPAKAREGLRAWHSISKLAGADVTHGAAGAIARALGLTEQEEEEEKYQVPLNAFPKSGICGSGVRDDIHG